MGTIKRLYDKGNCHRNPSRVQQQLTKMPAQYPASGACEDNTEDSDIDQILRVSATRAGGLSHTQAVSHRRASAVCEDDAENSAPEKYTRYTVVF